MVDVSVVNNTNALSNYATIVATYNSQFSSQPYAVSIQNTLATFWDANNAASIDYTSGGFATYTLVGNTITYEFDRWKVSCTGTTGASFSSINDLKITDQLTGVVWDIQGTLNFSDWPWLSDLTSGSITEASVRVPVGADLSFTRVIGNLTYSGGSFSGAITEIDTVILNNAGTLSYVSADTGYISVYTSPGSTTASGALESGFLGFFVNGVATGDALSYSNANFSISQSPSQVLQGNDHVVLSGALGSSFHAGAGNDSVLGSPGNDSIFGDAGDDLIRGGPGNDVIDGGAQVDTAIYTGLRSQYTITRNPDYIVTIRGPDGTDTLNHVERLQFDDGTFDLPRGTARAINPATADPDTFMPAIRDFDGNDLGAGTDWNRIGSVDVEGDGNAEVLFVNPTIGRWATVGVAADGKIYMDNHNWGGDTRVVGTYIDPLITLGIVEAGSDFDSQRRFVHDLKFDNISGILNAGDYNHDGLQEIYFGIRDGTAYLHAYMHADGNIQYANYQVASQVQEYLGNNGYTADYWDHWL